MFGDLFGEDDSEENPALRCSVSARVTAIGAPIAGNGTVFIFHVSSVLQEGAGGRAGGAGVR